MPTPTNKQLISALYVATFNRAPGQDGLQFWEGAFNGDQDHAMKALSAAFVTHPAFAELYDDLNDLQFVEAIYQNVLGGPGETSGVLFWTDALTAGVSRSDMLAAFVKSALTAEFPNPSLTPEENQAAQTRQDFLYNKANVGLTFANVLGSDSNISPTTDSSKLEGPNGLLSDPAYQASIDILKGVTDDDDTALNATSIIFSAAGTSDPIQYIIDNAPDAPPPPAGLEKQYTTAIDHLVGTAGNDTFTGSIGDPITGDTLQSGDTANGGGGNDVVNVAIYGDGAVLTGINTTGIETISVKALTTANEGSTLDLSGTKGVTTLESFETDGAQLTFSDIQTVDTDIRIVDTNETHTFIYDLNAYHADPSQNIVDLTLQELRDAEINFGDKLDPAVGQSQATQIDITSTVRPGTPVSSAVNNLVSDLNVGDELKKVYIDGDANLQVTAPLDVNIELVDAHVVGNLTANLWLDMSNSNDGAPLVDDGVVEIIYEGALGDDHIEFGTTNNAKQVRLVTGNDWVRTGTGVASVDGGDGNDTIITGALNDLVIGGAGNDTVIDSGADNSTSHENIWYWDNGNNFDLGAGNDSLTVNGNGNNTVSAGEGNDSVGLYGDGNNSVVAGAGDDVITIIGDANVFDHAHAHYIDLGEGNDTLTIQGGVNIEVPQDFNAVTTIIGGAGNDTVVIDGPLEINTNHVLNANLGDGNDSITLRADDLRNNDTVSGGSNVDTLVLTNASGLSETGLVRDSETQRTSSFENIDLRDQGIYFSLTDNLIASADGNTGSADDNAITVITESANGTQTVDMTALTVPTFLEDNFFNLRGGDFQDIVVADEESINSFNVLRFDNPNNTVPDATDDTLRIVDGAQLTYGDLYKVSGLEHIELTAASTFAQTWEVELNSTIINQTTANADLVISVDPNVTAGSKLYVTVDPTLLANSDSNVRILRNGNVDVYVNGQLVIEDQFDNVQHPNELIAFNPFYGLYVQTALQFTTNQDYLVGTQFDDTFTADSVDQVQAADSALGYGGFDTVSLNFAVGNSNETLYDQLDYVQLDSIERIEFNTGNSVRMDGIDYEDALFPWFAPDLQELATGQSADTLTNMRQGVSYDLGAGNDFISLDDRWDHSVFLNTTVDGGLGIDTVEGTVGEDREFGGSDSISISNVEFVYDYSIDDADHVDILATGSQAAGGLITLNNIEVITATAGDDNIQADSDGGVIWLDGEEGEDTLVVGLNTPSRTTVAGGYDADEITVRATNYALVFGDYMNASAHGGPWVPGQSITTENTLLDGNDNIDVTLVADGGGQAIVYGQGGNDTIDVTSVYAHSNEASVDGGSGHDDINVSYMEYATIFGGSGDDSNYIENGVEKEVSITSEYNHYATVDGGDGNDNIIVLSNVEGEATIIGGAGDDTITITDSIGVDTLQFGDITYNLLQQPTDTQGLDQINGYNWEAVNPPGDAGPINQDVMDFRTFFDGSPVSGNDIAENAVLYAGSPFIPGSLVPLVLPTPAHNATWEHGVTVDANFFAGDSLVVLSTQGLTLTAADFSVNQLGTIQLNDNARAVVVVGTNETSPGNGISEFDIYFVQDIDTGAGPAQQTWAVDHVASVDSLTLVGINSVFENLANNY